MREEFKRNYAAYVVDKGRKASHLSNKVGPLSPLELKNINYSGNFLAQG